MAEFFGIVGGFLTTTRPIPQMVESLKKKETDDFSFIFAVIFFKLFFMIFYGIFKPDYLILYESCTHGMLSHPLDFKSKK